MNLIKKCLTSLLLVMMMFVVIPSSHLFADENDGIMLTGSTTTVSVTKYAYVSGTYKCGASYGVRFVLNATYEKTSSGISNIRCTYSSGAYAIEDPGSCLAQVASTSIKSIKYKGNSAIVTLEAKVNVSSMKSEYVEYIVGTITLN